MGNSVPEFRSWFSYVENDEISLLPFTISINERIRSFMAHSKKRSNSKKSRTTPIATYTVTVAHEPDAECDSCAQPRSVLIEQEGGAWVCEVCLGGASDDAFWKMAVINGLHSWGSE